MCVGCGGLIDHVLPFATLTADASGRELVAPYFRPHKNLTLIRPLMVTMVALLLLRLSAAHLAKPIGEHHSRGRHAH